MHCTGKSFLEAALILASTNLQYDKRLFIDLPVQYMRTTKFDNRGGCNNSREDGKNFICVGEKAKRLDIFLNIDKRGGSNNNG